MQVTILGSGSWGTALSLVLLENGHKVSLWSYKKEQANAMRESRINPLLSGNILPPELNISHSLEELSQSSVVIFAVPSFAIRELAAQVKPYISPNTVLVTVSKGIEKGSFLRLSQVIESEIPNTPVVVLSGPSHAEEVGQGMPTGLVAASDQLVHGELIQDIFMNSYIRVYTSKDKMGTELCGAFKNIMAICVGFCDGMQSGDNTKAMLMTRGLAEMARLGVALGANRETFNGLAGVGDLIVTCTSPHSRNRRFGIAMGEGATAEEAKAQAGGVVEGYYATATAFALAESVGIEIPIVQGAYEVLFHGKQPLMIMEKLMLRAKRSEEDPIWQQ